MIIKYFYFFILSVCFIVSIVVFKFNKGLKIFPWLIGSVAAVEASTFVMSSIYNINPNMIFHFYILVEGGTMGYFFYFSANTEKIKKVVLVMVGLFLTGSLTLTFFFYHFTDFPGLSINVLGLMEIIISIYLLLTLEPIYEIPLYKHPLAWICIGIIVFYTGTFFLNGIYNYLVVTHSVNRVLLHSVINNGLNAIMYLCFSVGLICSHRLKKYFEHGGEPVK